MAALTWREVSNPNFGSANEMFRTANQSFDRAMSGLGDTIKNFQAEQIAGQEGALLAKAMQIQDPAAMKAALASGELLQGVNLGKVNPKVLGQLDGRVGQLLNQAATQQGMDSTALNMEGKRYDIDRTKGQDQIEDAARGQLAAQLGLTGPLAQMSTADQQTVAKTKSGLRGDALSQQGTALMNEARAFNNSTAKRDDQASQGAMAESAGLLQRNATVDDLRRDFEETPYATPQQRAMVQAQLEKATGQRLYAPIGSDQPVSGGGKSGSKNSTPSAPDVSNPESKAAMQDLDRRTQQNNTAGIVADIEKNMSDTRSAPQVAKDLAEFLPEGNQGSVNDLITAAQAKYPKLSPADIGSAISRSTTGNFFGSDSVGGTGVDRSRFDAMLEEVNTGKADYNSAQNQRVRSVRQGIQKADQKLAEAKAEAAALHKRAESQISIDTSRADEKVERMQEALEKAIARKDDDDMRPIYQKPPSEKEKRRPQRGRANNQRP